MIQLVIFLWTKEVSRLNHLVIFSCYSAVLIPLTELLPHENIKYHPLLILNFKVHCDSVAGNGCFNVIFRFLFIAKFQVHLLNLQNVSRATVSSRLEELFSLYKRRRFLPRSIVQF